jgi:hypothetical protein
MKLDDLPEWKDLTPEQQQQVNAVIKQARKNGLKFGLSMVAWVFGSSLLISLLNAFYVQSESFPLVAGLLSGVLFANASMRAIAEEHDRVRKELKNILQK